ncbi:MAG TPA: DUF6229 family protein [Candidatus Angelobacter sp.]|jgi:hypothetical protein
MNNTLYGGALVEHWRKDGGQNNPAGPLFASGQFAEADIVNATAEITCGTACSGSITRPCC